MKTFPSKTGFDFGATKISPKQGTLVYLVNRYAVDGDPNESPVWSMHWNGSSINRASLQMGEVFLSYLSCQKYFEYLTQNDLNS